MAALVNGIFSRPSLVSIFKDLTPYEPIELMWPIRAQGPEWYLGCPQVGQFSSKVIKERVNFWFSMKIAQ